MALFRTTAGDGVAWITGASTGIGRELALRLAALGHVVVATARNSDDLDDLARESEGMRGTIRAFPGDVTDRAAMASMVKTIGESAGPIRLAVFNAGVYIPTPGEALSLDDFDTMIGVNLLGVLNGLVPVVETMKAAGCGQVVLVGSVSGYSGLPSASAYGATKAALNNMAESLSFDFEKMNIRIQVANPGFVDTPATRENDFEMPALMPVDKAAQALVEGIAEGGFEITFPRRFTYVLKLLRMLPHPIYFAIMRRATGWGTRELDFRDTTPSTYSQG